MILFDITTTEMKLAESEAVKCKLCPFLWPVDAAEGEYLAARRTWDGAWQFGLGAMTDVKNNNGRKIGATFSFNPIAFGMQEFLAIVDDGEVASTPWSKSRCLPSLVHSAAGEIPVRPMNLFPTVSKAIQWPKTG